MKTSIFDMALTLPPLIEMTEVEKDMPMNTMMTGLTFTGLSMIDASLAIIVVHLEVPSGVLLAILVFRERPGLLRLCGMVVSFLGVVLIAGLPDTEGQLLAIILTGSGAVIWAVGQVMYKRISDQLDGFTGIAWLGVLAAPQMLLGSFIFEEGQWEAVKHATWIGWGSVAYLGLVMTVAGYGVWFTVLRRNLSLIHISSPRDRTRSRMPSSA